VSVSTRSSREVGVGVLWLAWFVLTVLGLAVIMSVSGCAAVDAQPRSNVQLVAKPDEWCSVYRIDDAGRVLYFAKCVGDRNARIEMLIVP
jgi:hypothetical protein